MSEEVLMHLSSNSNQSDPSLTSKLAKLEARMAGKAASSVQTSWPSVSSAPKAEGADDAPETSPSSDSDDDIVEDFLIQPNINKRPRFQEEEQVTGVQQAEATDGRARMLEAMDLQISSNDGSRKRSTRGRGRSVTGRGRGPKACDQSRPQASVSSMSLSNGHFETSSHKIGSESSDSLLLQTKINPSTYNQEGWLKERASVQEEITLLKGKVASLEEELSKSRHEVADHQALLRQLEKELRDLKDQEQQMKPKRMKVLSDLLISVAKAERQESRMKIRQDSLRLGNVGVIRAGTIISETWEDGQTLKDIQSQLRNLWDAKEVIERHRKSLKKRQSDKSDGSDHESGIPEEDFLIQDEICKSRLLSIKREEELLLKEKDRYELEKGRHIRELKRIRDEDGSRFNNFQILNHRYALLNLLGKGGFSEVYKAYDLLEYRYVACKLHGLNAQWSEEKKQSYIRHAIREYNIHKSLVHQHIVRLWDTFEIDHNTFCTVLECCSGKDLDAVLKTTPILPEKEARIIIAQIFQGLVYLNRRTQKIIHYDLKPGNVLFDEVGVAKVTDFGLSKVVDDDVGSQGMELTSQGAGTYWYLPPECFELNRTPLISSKVDVWSAGVLLFQMLFGKRPFGHDQTQERILREDTIIRARKVEFPPKPTVSNEAKDFIRRCLTYNQAERPDVLTVAQDPYLSYAKK
ncbi:serine/threonine-protein kinase TOUSLED isoform X2 [Nymphaea colorata]|uniref:serine/threonine-protein kinase TOUSLED isoform X2 n=1 Tax=Nymphaea colorata TaxID=210225 RepID=UPI00129EE6CF|nr:serine/threonine-protein kinase TOUSLED isoform X2 [Nymphaea colorata]